LIALQHLLRDFGRDFYGRALTGAYSDARQPSLTRP
tara:strand:+ start:2653 stop:2760 length:108 start_codon:yes stop_codon:yes gene_type:complete